MVAVGVVFVVNSLDSLIRLYTLNFGFTVSRFGHLRYIAGNWLVLAALVLLFQFTPLKIEWIGLVVVGIYLGIYFLVLKKRRKLTADPE
jgi:cadmium resistance protein CadD (predicted permease)